MRWLATAAWPLVGVLLAACLDVGTGTGPGAAASASKGDAAAGSTPDAAAPSGTGCFRDPSSGTVLCAQSSACPGVVVDPGIYPDCGFRLQGSSTFDVECVCDGRLCPLGAPDGCAAVEQLLRGQNGLVVCEQVNEGRCIVPSGADDAGEGTGSPCDKDCESRCAGDPSCMQLCGC